MLSYESWDLDVVCCYLIRTILCKFFEFPDYERLVLRKFTDQFAILRGGSFGRYIESSGEFVLKTTLVGFNITKDNVLQSFFRTM